MVFHESSNILRIWYIFVEHANMAKMLPIRIQKDEKIP